MAFDSRHINPEKVIELLEQRLNSKHLEIYYLRFRENDNSTTFLFVIRVFAILFDYTFKYNDSELKIKEMNKILKRKNDSKGISTEELIADKVYSGFMKKWISYPKISKENNTCTHSKEK